MMPKWPILRKSQRGTFNAIQAGRAHWALQATQAALAPRAGSTRRPCRKLYHSQPTRHSGAGGPLRPPGDDLHDAEAEAFLGVRLHAYRRQVGQAARPGVRRQTAALDLRQAIGRVDQHRFQMESVPDQVPVGDLAERYGMDRP